MTTRPTLADERARPNPAETTPITNIFPLDHRRVIIENVTPEIDAGRYPIKRVVGDAVEVEADIFADGHAMLAGILRYRAESDSIWSETPLAPLKNDRWRASFVVSEVGRYRYTFEAWIDPFQSWQHDLAKRVEAQQDVAVDLQTGANLVEAASARATGAAAAQLLKWSALLRGSEVIGLDARIQLALSPALATAMAGYPDRQRSTTYARELVVVVDPEYARYSTWYELFPRSTAPASPGEPPRHGTFRDIEKRLPYVASLGFDVLYLPPIHPIGHTFRKGKNNSTVAGPADPGSPWGIGSEDGGHTAIHPGLGTLEDFRRLVAQARVHGLSLALDLAFQCSPDHPYVTNHPEWFTHRPDGSIQYAENPPKKYQDIYPLDFESADWQGLWNELKRVVLFWIDQGVSIFRVDNPHTKPIRFWEWLIGEVKHEHPEVIFLAEAFTRPKIMKSLAKSGFSQSYTYFAWRNTKHEITTYFTELTQTEPREYFRPNLWPNTPDILTEYLQYGGRPAFLSRLVLAATLGASYGIYGPAFELGENRSLEPGREEYLDSEKYEIRQWNLDHPDSLKEVIARVNQIRRENPALQRDDRLRFHPIDNDQLVAYSKRSADLTDIVIVVVNLDPYHTQSGWLELPLREMGLDEHQPYQLHDLLSDARYLWHGPRNYVELDPRSIPAHILRVRRHVRTERDFEYYF